MSAVMSASRVFWVAVIAGSTVANCGTQQEEVRAGRLWERAREWRRQGARARPADLGGEERARSLANTTQSRAGLPTSHRARTYARGGFWGASCVTAAETEARDFFNSRFED